MTHKQVFGVEHSKDQMQDTVRKDERGRLGCSRDVIGKLVKSVDKLLGRIGRLFNRTCGLCSRFKSVNGR